MGVYVYKTLRHQVDLANGEKANVAVFAYKPYYWSEVDQHSKSGAAACDRQASAGKRSNWVISGYVKDDGKIEIYKGTEARDMGRALGSFYDESMDGKPSCAMSGAPLRKPLILVNSPY